MLPHARTPVERLFALHPEAQTLGGGATRARRPRPRPPRRAPPILVPCRLGLLHGGEGALAQSFRQLADGHGDEPDVYHLCHSLAQQCDEHERRLAPIVERYGEQPDSEPERFRLEAMSESRTGALALLRDLQDVRMLVSFVDTTWTVVKQAALALRDEELLAVTVDCERQTKLQQDWLLTRIKQAAPQALLVAS